MYKKTNKLDLAAFKRNFRQNVFKIKKSRKKRIKTSIAGIIIPLFIVHTKQIALD